jgi:glutathione peroxidase
MHLISFVFLALLNGFYSLSVPLANGQSLSMDQFRGKKLLLVNIATGSPLRSQLSQLEQFYRLHRDSVVVIGFPSNSFGNEPKTAAELQAYFTDSVAVTFPVAAPGRVTGPDAHAVYRWLAQPAQNGVATFVPSKDFQKVLISRGGQPTGIFAGTVQPGDSLLLKAIALP